MRIIFIIHLIIFSLGMFSQTTGYVLQKADGTISIPDSSISTAKISGLLSLLSQKQNILGFTPKSVTDSGRATSNYITGGGLKKINDSTIAAIATLYGNDFRAANFVAGTNYLAPNGNGSQLTGLTATQVGLGNVTNESKATMFTNPAFTGTATGLTKAMVGLGNVDNTSDASKPISTATQTAINLKQDALVSGTNIKTVNGNTLLGSGDVVVGGGATSSTSGVATTATASGTQTITHNLGRTPTIIRIYSISSFTSNAAATPVPFSTGIWNSSGNRCLYMVINGTTTQASQTSTTFSIIMVTSAGNQITGVIQNVTNTGFDIVWTETGTHTAGNFLWEAQ